MQTEQFHSCGLRCPFVVRVFEVGHPAFNANKATVS